MRRDGDGFSLGDRRWRSICGDNASLGIRRNRTAQGLRWAECAAGGIDGAGAGRGRAATGSDPAHTEELIVVGHGGDQIHLAINGERTDCSHACAACICKLNRTDQRSLLAAASRGQSSSQSNRECKQPAQSARARSVSRTNSGDQRNSGTVEWAVRPRLYEAQRSIVRRRVWRSAHGGYPESRSECESAPYGERNGADSGIAEDGGYLFELFLRAPIRLRT